MKVKNNLFICFFTISLIFFACRSNNDKWNGTIQKNKGITKVINTNEPIYKNDVLNFQEEFVIGANDKTDKPLFNEIRDIAVDDNGRIFVLDPKDAVIKTFNDEGTFINIIGGKGQGPGELERPVSLYITKNNRLIVTDPPSRKIHFFESNNGFIKSISYSNLNMFQGPKVDLNGNMIARYLITGPEVDMVLKVFNNNLEESVTLFKAKSLKFPILNPFFPKVFWAINNKNEIVWGYSKRYEINIVDNKETVKKIISRDYVPVKIEEEEKSKWIKNRFGGLEFVPKFVKLQWDKYHNAFRSLIINDLDHMIIGTYEKTLKGECYYYDLFDDQGRYLLKFSFKESPKVWKKGRIYTIETDDVGYRVVKVYRVNWSVDLDEYKGEL